MPASCAPVLGQRTLMWDVSEPELADRAYNPKEFYELVDPVNTLARDGSLNNVEELIGDIREDLALAERYGFIQTEAGLFIPR